MGHVAGTEIKNAYRILVKNILRIEHVGDLHPDKRIILKRVLRDDEMLWIVVMWLRLFVKVTMDVRAF